jgi:glycosyltransferase involved in cell wall biosynthesis
MLACLTPIRNAAGDLEGFLESAARVADAVLVLDDGSDDGTAELLRAEDRVDRLLTNPPRHDHAGWDDAANRQRLLDAAMELEPDWVLWLDADERIDGDDAAALRAFLDGDAVPGCAYGLQLFRAWDEEAVVPAPTYVYRLFAPGSDLRLPKERLHLNPIPISIPRALWLSTTIRLRHLDSPERVERRRRKYAEADPAGEWERGAGPRLDPPENVVPWRPRDPALPVLVSGTGVERASILPVDQGRPTLACLLPTRNEEQHVDGFLDCAARFADKVLVLDDGSTDRSAELFGSHDLVEIVGSNPARDSYEGWDDAENRQRLLDAAIERRFDWVMFLDADERIDPDDAVALKSLVAGEGCREHAYGFRRYQMIGDGSSHDRVGLWVYRLFAPRAGDELSSDRLHFIPIPESRQPNEWRRTTIRIQHLAGLTPELRRSRRRKYEEADPERRWQSSYEHLLEDPVEPRVWAPRPPGFPVLADPRERGPGAELDLTALDVDAPVISAICIAQDDAETIAESVAAIAGQHCDFPFETIVVVSGSDATARIVRERFPEVRLVEIGEPVLPGRARNAGLAIARGQYITFPGSHVILEPGHLEARVRAHELGYAMVTGPVLNGTDTTAGWASYFMDNPTALPGSPSGPLERPPVRCSYLRELLVDVGGFPEEVRTGEDTAVNNELWLRGHDSYTDADVLITHRTPCRRPRDLILHHYKRGRGLARVVSGELGSAGAMARRKRRRYVARYVPRRLLIIDRGVRRWGGSTRRRYRDPRVRGLVLIGVLAAWAGLFSGLTDAARTRR